jgi:hypothetical protein
MSSINSKFAESLRTKIQKSKTPSSRQKRINDCLKKVQKELLTVSSIMNQITENEEIYEKYNILNNFCNEFDKLWLTSSDDDDYANYDEQNDPLNTAFYRYRYRKDKNK